MRYYNIHEFLIEAYMHHIILKHNLIKADEPRNLLLGIACSSCLFEEQVHVTKLKNLRYYATLQYQQMPPMQRANMANLVMNLSQWIDISKEPYQSQLNINNYKFKYILQ